MEQHGAVIRALTKNTIYNTKHSAMLHPCSSCMLHYDPGSAAASASKIIMLHPVLA
jgi:hypothetical protein